MDGSQELREEVRVLKEGIFVKNSDAINTLLLGEQDYFASRILLQHGLGFYGLFHCHRAIEKHLKGILIENGILMKNLKNKYGHDLTTLLSEAQKSRKGLKGKRFVHVVRSFSFSQNLVYIDDIIDSLKRRFPNPNKTYSIDGERWTMGIDYAMHILKNKEGLKTTYFKMILASKRSGDLWKLRQSLLNKNSFFN